MPVSPNFRFLEEAHPHLVALAAMAERYFSDDPSTALIKLRQFGELLARESAAQAGLEVEPGRAFADILGDLQRAGLLPPLIRTLFHELRIETNAALHEGRGTHGHALHQLKNARQVGIWFFRTFGKAPASFSPGPFIPPAARIDDFEERDLWAKLADEAAAKLQWLGVAEAAIAYEASRLPERLQALAAEAAEKVNLDEADTRHLIDAQLREAGWEADSQELRCSRGARPIAGRNRAIAEWSTASGPADYVLFIGRMPVGVVEAKRKHKDVAGVVDQSRRYSEGFALGDDFEAPGGPWGKLKVPFLFATNGRGYLKQLETQSGIQFRDGRRKTNHTHALPGWYSPEGLKGLLRQDMDEAEKQLASEPVQFPAGLYAHQVKGIHAIEKALADGQRACLLAMATGTGKTRTALGLIYRLVKANRFRRVLFLVDRNALGVQAQDVFKDIRLEQQQDFTEIYNVKKLGHIKPMARPGSSSRPSRGW